MTHPLPWINQSFWRRGSPGPCPSPFQTSWVIFKGVDISGRKYKLVLASFSSYGELKARHALGLILFQTFFPFLISFFRFQSPCQNMRPSCYTFLFYRLKSSLVDTFFQTEKGFVEGWENRVSDALPGFLLHWSCFLLCLFINKALEIIILKYDILNDIALPSPRWSFYAILLFSPFSADQYLSLYVLYFRFCPCPLTCLQT